MGCGTAEKILTDMIPFCLGSRPLRQADDDDLPFLLALRRETMTEHEATVGAEDAVRPAAADRKRQLCGSLPR